MQVHESRTVYKTELYQPPAPEDPSYRVVQSSPPSSKAPPRATLPRVAAPQLRCLFRDCSEGFASPEGLTKHTHTDHPDYRPFPCQAQGCDRTFYTNTTLQKHIRDDHDFLEPYPRFTNCQWPNCDYVISTRAAYVAHWKEVHEVGFGGGAAAEKTRPDLLKDGETQDSNRKLTSKRTFKCEHSTCEEMFESFQSMRYHRQQAHNEGEWVRCHECQFAFSDARRLASHRLREHGRHCCQYKDCGNAEFATADELEQHRLVGLS
jgi:hypothetical protein